MPDNSVNKAEGVALGIHLLRETAGTPIFVLWAETTNFPGPPFLNLQNGAGVECG